MTTNRTPAWLSADSGDFDTFRQIVGQTARPEDTPLASAVVRNIPVYDGAAVDAAALDPAARQALMEEWAHVFAQGAGIVVIKQGVADHAVIDRASAVFDAIIADPFRAVSKDALQEVTIIVIDALDELPPFALLSVLTLLSQKFILLPPSVKLLPASAALFRRNNAPQPVSGSLQSVTRNAATSDGRAPER
jgi:hypothetical protein